MPLASWPIRRAKSSSAIDDFGIDLGLKSLASMSFAAKGARHDGLQRRILTQQICKDMA